jgi:formylmethanofuran dehydrogenase subunit E
MALVKVWNDHEQEHVEQFESVTVQPPTACYQDIATGKHYIRIPAKSCVEMEWEEGVALASKFYPIRKDGLGRELTAKKIRVEQPVDASKKPVHKCQACKEEFQTEKSLLLHSEAEHAAVMVDEDVRKTAESRRK